MCTPLRLAPSCWLHWWLCFLGSTSYCWIAIVCRLPCSWRPMDGGFLGTISCTFGKWHSKDAPTEGFRTFSHRSTGGVHTASCLQHSNGARGPSGDWTTRRTQCGAYCDFSILSPTALWLACLVTPLQEFPRFSYWWGTQRRSLQFGCCLLGQNWWVFYAYAHCQWA